MQQSDKPGQRKTKMQKKSYWIRKAKKGQIRYEKLPGKEKKEKGQ